MKPAIALFSTGLCLALAHATPAQAILTGSAPPLPKTENASASASAPVSGKGSAAAAEGSASGTMAASSTMAAGSAAANGANSAASANTAASPAGNVSLRPAQDSGKALPPALHAAPVSNLIQIISSLIVVLLLMFGCAWLLKNHGPRRLMARVPTRIIGGVNLGGRERIMVVEVGDQWLVVGSTPNQINLLTTLPRQESMEDEPIPGKQFSVWLKQVMEKRNG